jgi:putative oxidoreductase
MEKKQALGLALVRAIVGIVFLAHGSQKLFVFGFSGVTGFFSHLGIPFPAVAAVVVTLVEFLGGVALLIGLFTRYAAALIAIDMLVAILKVHLKGGFFLPAGYEFALTLLVASVALMIAGAGAPSVDALRGKR